MKHRSKSLHDSCLTSSRHLVVVYSPYHDCYMVTAQALSIGAFCLSWVWWIPFLIATPSLVMLQTIWCCKMKKRGVITAMIFCAISAFLLIFAGIYIILAWRDNTWCSVFLITRDDDDNWSDPNSDYCVEIAWAVISFVDAALFAGAALCLYIFAVFRMDKLIAQQSIGDDQDVEAVEMGEVMTIPAAPSFGVTADTAVAVAVASGSPDYFEKQDI